MIRNCSLKEISDGRLYRENDMVKADTGQNHLPVYAQDLL